MIGHNQTRVGRKQILLVLGLCNYTIMKRSGEGEKGGKPQGNQEETAWRWEGQCFLIGMNSTVHGHCAQSL